MYLVQVHNLYQIYLRHHYLVYGAVIPLPLGGECEILFYT
jgi:hypothetical protein